MPMEWLEQVVDLLGNALDGFLTSRKKSRDIFILKALSNVHSNHVGFSIRKSPLHLNEIEGLLRMAQLIAAGSRTGDSCYFEPFVTSQDNSPYYRKLKKIEWRYGLPALNDPRRLNKIETILLDMTRSGKLRFHPPDRWSVVQKQRSAIYP